MQIISLKQKYKISAENAYFTAVTTSWHLHDISSGAIWAKAGHVTLVTQ